MRKIRNIFFAVILAITASSTAHATQGGDYADAIANAIDFTISDNAFNVLNLQKTYPCLGEDFKAERLNLVREGTKIVSFNSNFAQYLRENESQEVLKGIHDFLRTKKASEYIDDLIHPKFSSSGALLFPSVSSNVNSKYPNKSFSRLVSLTSSWIKSPQLKALTTGNPSLDLNEKQTKELPAKYLAKDPQTGQLTCGQ